MKFATLALLTTVFSQQCSKVPGGAVCGSSGVYPLIQGGSENSPLMPACLLQQQKCQPRAGCESRNFLLNFFKTSHFAAVPPRNEPTLAILGGLQSLPALALFLGAAPVGMCHFLRSWRGKHCRSSLAGKEGCSKQQLVAK